ncbi:MAG: LysR family transcriptional regulator [Verrucomicrobiota bacterium]
MNIRINSLKVFVDLAENGNFSATAARHGISQPAVSQQIGGLEEEFATQLVERSRRRFRLTPAGQALLQTARGILQEINSLKAKMTDLEECVRGELQVVTTSNLSVEWLPRIAAGLQAVHPHIQLEIVYCPANRVYAEVIGNVADLALVACPREDERFISVIIAEEIFSFVATAPRSKQIKSLDLKNLPFIAYAPDPPTAQLSCQALHWLDSAAAPILQFEHPDTVIKAIQATQGFSCLPQTAIQAALAGGELVEIFTGQPKIVRQLAVVFQKQRAHHPLLKAVHGFLESFARSQLDQQPKPRLVARKAAAKSHTPEPELSAA